MKTRDNVLSYYERKGEMSDGLFRCAACNRLITHARLIADGNCSCGNRRVTEVRALNFREWLRIRLGLLRFPSRIEFLKEFSPWK